MPELAEVDYFRRQWQPGIGLPVIGVELHSLARVYRDCDTEGLSSHLRHAVLQVSLSHGKHLLFGFSSGGWLGLHLGMTGELRVETGAPPAMRHDHLVLRQPGQSLVFADSRMFGRVRFDVSPSQPPSWWRALPPGLLSRGFSAASVAEFLRRRARSPIKALLLDQSAFPGIGNWMADEILWRIRLHPLNQAGAVSDDQSDALHRQTQWVARRALATIGVDWRDPPAGWLYRHRWAAGTRCPRPACRTPLLRAETAGRTTCWCPECQPAPPTTELWPTHRPVGTGRRRETPVRRTTGRG